MAQDANIIKEHTRTKKTARFAVSLEESSRQRESSLSKTVTNVTDNDLHKHSLQNSGSKVALCHHQNNTHDTVDPTHSHHVKYKVSGTDVSQSYPNSNVTIQNSGLSSTKSKLDPGNFSHPRLNTLIKPLPESGNVTESSTRSQSVVHSGKIHNTYETGSPNSVAAPHYFILEKTKPEDTSSKSQVNVSQTTFQTAADVVTSAQTPIVFSSTINSTAAYKINHLHSNNKNSIKDAANAGIRTLNRAINKSESKTNRSTLRNKNVIEKHSKEFVANTDVVDIKPCISNHNNKIHSNTMIKASKIKSPTNSTNASFNPVTNFLWKQFQNFVATKNSQTDHKNNSRTISARTTSDNFAAQLPNKSQTANYAGDQTVSKKIDSSKNLINSAHTQLQLARDPKHSDSVLKLSLATPVRKDSCPVRINNSIQSPNNITSTVVSAQINNDSKQSQNKKIITAPAKGSKSSINTRKKKNQNKNLFKKVPKDAKKISDLNTTVSEENTHLETQHESVTKKEILERTHKPTENMLIRNMHSSLKLARNSLEIIKSTLSSHGRSDHTFQDDWSNERMNRTEQLNTTHYADKINEKFSLTKNAIGLSEKPSVIKSGMTMSRLFFTPLDVNSMILAGSKHQVIAPSLCKTDSVLSSQKQAQPGTTAFPENHMSPMIKQSNQFGKTIKSVASFNTASVNNDTLGSVSSMPLHWSDSPHTLSHSLKLKQRDNPDYISKLKRGSEILNLSDATSWLGQAFYHLHNTLAHSSNKPLSNMTLRTPTLSKNASSLDKNSLSTNLSETFMHSHVTPSESKLLAHQLFKQKQATSGSNLEHYSTIDKKSSVTVENMFPRSTPYITELYTGVWPEQKNTRFLHQTSAESKLLLKHPQTINMSPSTDKLKTRQKPKRCGKTKSKKSNQQSRTNKAKKSTKKIKSKKPVASQSFVTNNKKISQKPFAKLDPSKTSVKTKTSQKSKSFIKKQPSSVTKISNKSSTKLKNIVDKTRINSEQTNATQTSSLERSTIKLLKQKSTQKQHSTTEMKGALTEKMADKSHLSTRSNSKQFIHSVSHLSSTSDRSKDSRPSCTVAFRLSVPNDGKPFLVNDPVQPFLTRTGLRYYEYEVT